ncbi:hypothetical protein [Sporosarcina koreensis]|uniref:Uncharacterized protein n=1 Tax=Sporosarcina koreensis TaxID=334735 RepID=A0ABW0TVJ7_9BACL
MKRFIPLVIVVLFTQLLAMIMWGEYVRLSNIKMGFAIVGTQIQPTLWFVFVIEIILLVICFKKIE